MYHRDGENCKTYNCLTKVLIVVQLSCNNYFNFRQEGEVRLGIYLIPVQQWPLVGETILSNILIDSSGT